MSEPSAAGEPNTKSSSGTPLNDEVSKDKVSLKSKEKCCIAAPMVRASILPFRQLCHAYGADLVYSEEIVGWRLAKCVRVVSEHFNTIEFRSTLDGNLTFATIPEERNVVILQLGVSDPETAVTCTKLVSRDVRGIDVNFGCPKSFSVGNGMGAALLKDVRRARSILTALRAVIEPPKLLTCKIRLLSSNDETIAFLTMCLDCGVDAVTVHARTVAERPAHPAQWEVFKFLRQAIGPVPVLFANGDFLSLQSIANLKDQIEILSSIDGIMIARGCLQNPSIFRCKSFLNKIEEPPQLDAPLDISKKLISLSLETGTQLNKLKWLLLEMLKLSGAPLNVRENILKAKTMAALCEVFQLTDLYREVRIEKHPEWPSNVYTNTYYRDLHRAKIACVTNGASPEDTAPCTTPEQNLERGTRGHSVSGSDDLLQSAKKKRRAVEEPEAPSAAHDQ